MTTNKKPKGLPSHMGRVAMCCVVDDDDDPGGVKLFFLDARFARGLRFKF